MTNKKRHSQPVIHHTSPLTVDRDQSQALRAARKILQSPAPKPLPSPIKKPKRKK